MKVWPGPRSVLTSRRRLLSVSSCFCGCQQPRALLGLEMHPSIHSVVTGLPRVLSSNKDARDWV